MTYETILLEIHGRVGLITLNRPQALNALNAQLVSEVNQALDALEADRATSAASSSPVRKKPLPPVPTSRKWPS